MLSKILLLLFSTNAIAAWSGIVMDGFFDTQLYVPGNPSIYTSNVNFGLSHRVGQAAVMFNGSAYFMGGGYSPDTTNLVTIFNPSTNTSTNGAPLNIARIGHAATVVGDTIIVCGGYTDIASCEQYNPSTQKWNMITSLPTPSEWSIMTTLNNRAYTFGGSYACDGSASPVYMFDGQNWVTRSSIAGLPHTDHAGVALDTDRALICGGKAYKGGSCRPVSDCFIYSASSNSWTKAASMAQIRCQHSMVMFEGERSKNYLEKL
jgi:N-acetylneuraminic acid mutarotase